MILAIALLLSSQSIGSQSQTLMDADVKALSARKPAISRLKETSPQQYIDQSLAWIDELAHIADVYSSVPQSSGVQTLAAVETKTLGDFARFKMHDPRQAAALYKRAAVRAGSPIGFNDQIADVYEFDLHDAPAAAAAFRELRKAIAASPRQTRADYIAWNSWYLHWFDAEIAYLERGISFKDPVSGEDVTGFAQTLFFLGGGAGMTTPELIDPALNIYSPPKFTAEEAERKLLPLPPSHSMFLRTYIFVPPMRAAAVRTWLARNDPAGFWTACFLTLAAAIERDLGNAIPKDHNEKFWYSFIRNDSRQPTALAILAREFAKNHPIPREGPRSGH